MSAIEIAPSIQDLLFSAGCLMATILAGHGVRYSTSISPILSPSFSERLSLASLAAISLGALTGMTSSVRPGYRTCINLTTEGQKEDISGPAPSYSSRNVSIAALISPQARDTSMTSSKPMSFSPCTITFGSMSRPNCE